MQKTGIRGEKGTCRKHYTMIDRSYSIHIITLNGNGLSIPIKDRNYKNT